jgi:hypothetical protein
MDDKAIKFFTNESIIDFSNQIIGGSVGFNTGARFFLAGGVYKSLLTHCPPRDLDIWAPTEADRKLIIKNLLSMGAKKLHGNRYTKRYQFKQNMIELPINVESSLEKQLKNFDLVLSAIGVEFQPSYAPRVFLHPKINYSISRKVILLLDPLLNWRHALTTLERMRRYAEELRFEVPPEEEEKTWSIFDKQTREIQNGMIERYLSASEQKSTVLSESKIRLKN